MAKRIMMGRWLASFVVLASLSVATAGCWGGGPGGFSPRISVLSSELTFNPIAVGWTVTRPIHVTNEGRVPLEIRGVGIGTANAFSVSSGTLLSEDCDGLPRATTSPQIIEPGECAAIRVRFVPLAVGGATTDIVVHSDDPNNPTMTIHAAGTAVPLSAIDPGLYVCALDSDGLVNADECSNAEKTQGGVPEVYFGRSSFKVVRKVRLLNNGSSDLDVTGITLQSDTSDIILSSEVMTPLKLAPQDHVDVELALDPHGCGEVSGSLLIDSQSLSHGQLSVPLFGTENCSTR